MKAEIRHDYLDLESADFIEDLDVSISEQGIYIRLRTPDLGDSGEPYIEFVAVARWESLFEESLKDLVDDCRSGHGGVIDTGDLSELCNELIATLEKFIGELRMLPQKAKAETNVTPTDL